MERHMHHLKMDRMHVTRTESKMNLMKSRWILSVELKGRWKQRSALKIQIQYLDRT
jgi:hypothetical protein